MAIEVQQKSCMGRVAMRRVPLRRSPGIGATLAPLVAVLARLFLARLFLEDQSADQRNSGGHGQQLERVPDGLLETGSGDQECRVEDGVEREMHSNKATGLASSKSIRRTLGHHHPTLVHGLV